MHREGLLQPVWYNNKRANNVFLVKFFANYFTDAKYIYVFLPDKILPRSGLDVRGRITPCALMCKGGGGRDIESMYCLLTFMILSFPIMGKHIECTNMYCQASS